MELNYASWGGGGEGGSRILRWKMAVDGAGVIFKLPITRRGDTYLFEIPDRLIAIFQMAERFNSQTAPFENTITHNTVTQKTNSADKGDLKGRGKKGVFDQYSESVSASSAFWIFVCTQNSPKI